MDEVIPVTENPESDWVSDWMSDVLFNDPETPRIMKVNFSLIQREEKCLV